MASPLNGLAVLPFFVACLLLLARDTASELELASPQDKAILAASEFPAVSIAAYPRNESTEPSYSQPDLLRREVLNSTNSFRTAYNASALAWNSTLAEYAKTVASDCIFKHSGGPYGENLAAGYANITASIEAWGRESVRYDFDYPTFSERTGHFTQLVWKNTTSVGCAAEQCDGEEDGKAPGWFLVCEYWPPGNVVGEFAQEVGDPVSPSAALGLRSQLRSVVGFAVATTGMVIWFLALT